MPYSLTASGLNGGAARTFATIAMLGFLHSANTASAQTSDGTVRGVVHAPNRIELSTDLSVPVVSTPFREGATFRKGDALITFACERYDADLRAAQAGYSAAATELKQKRHLLKNGAAGRGEVDLAIAQANRATAEIDAIKARMADCALEAPFDGRVVQMGTSQAQLPAPGQTLMIIIDNTRLEIELVVPSRWLRWIKPGSAFSFTVEETGETLPASVERVGAEVDPVSQTVTLYAVISGDTARVLAGMSGNAVFDIPSAEPLTGAVR